MNIQKQWRRETAPRRMRAPESSIEWKMYDALRLVASWEPYYFDVCGYQRGLGDPISIEPQVTVGPYRVDFMVSCQFGSETLRIAVECDGHEFHEKTKAQASRDKRRDRAIQRNGCRVFRFTGSDIFNDAHGCAREVISLAFDWLSGQGD